MPGPCLRAAAVTGAVWSVLVLFGELKALGTRQASGCCRGAGVPLAAHVHPEVGFNAAVGWGCQRHFGALGS